MPMSNVYKSIDDVPELNVHMTQEGFSVTKDDWTFTYHTKPVWDFEMQNGMIYNASGLLTEFNAELQTRFGVIRGNYKPPVNRGRGTMAVTRAPMLNFDDITWRDKLKIIEDTYLPYLSSEIINNRFMTEEKAISSKAIVSKQKDKNRTEPKLRKPSANPYDSLIIQHKSPEYYKLEGKPNKESYFDQRENFESKMFSMENARLSIDQAIRDMHIDQAYEWFTAAREMAEKSRVPMHVTIDMRV